MKKLMNEKVQKIKWGIIGLGKIATKFAEDMKLVEGGLLYAVASRDIHKAKKFSEKFNIEKYYGSYHELANDSEVDVVYIATPHVFHYENTLMCLLTRKSVLVEKPMGMNKNQIAEMIEEARKQRLFLMEGLWTRFIPATEKVLELLKNGDIGEVKFVYADFGFKAEYDTEGRVFNKQLGGGSLLDIGIYPIYLSLLTLGKPTAIKTSARMTRTGVDGSCTMLFDYESSANALLESTIEEDTPIEAYINGSEGSIKMHTRFHHTKRITLSRDNEPDEVYDFPYEGNGYQFEIEEVNYCLLNHQTESKRLPLNVSYDLTELMDLVREEIELKYETD